MFKVIILSLALLSAPAFAQDLACDLEIGLICPEGQVDQCAQPGGAKVHKCVGEIKREELPAIKCEGDGIKLTISNAKFEAVQDQFQDAYVVVNTGGVLTEIPCDRY